MGYKIQIFTESQGLTGIISSKLLFSSEEDALTYYIKNSEAILFDHGLERSHIKKVLFVNVYMGNRLSVYYKNDFDFETY